jgi:3',5'-cyclic AMP phosphodiesterase CpdA
MRIAITSDIHFHHPWYSRIRLLALQLQMAEPDLLILAGDIGEPLSLFEEGLLAFIPVCKKRAVIAGNHDVWHREMDYTSQQLWESYLPQSAARCGYTWLERGNIIVGDVGFCGTIAWYDYSASSSGQEFSPQQYQQLKIALSNDAAFIDWSWSDPEFSTSVSEPFLQRLDQLENDETVAEIIISTHVPLFREALRPTTTQEQAFANAYYGNLTLGEAAISRSKVSTIFSGHVHLGSNCEVIREGLRPITGYTIPADYGQPAALIFDTISREVTTIVIEESSTGE